MKTKCLICKQGKTRPQQANCPLQRQETTIIFKGAPADVCDNCGEYYLSENIAERLLQRAEEATLLTTPPHKLPSISIIGRRTLRVTRIR
ncbi:MAG: type II toxin-antitoxin system MqsA family antitoxin [Candidatus Binatia bacterium]